MRADAFSPHKCLRYMDVTFGYPRPSEYPRNNTHRGTFAVLTKRGIDKSSDKQAAVMRQVTISEPPQPLRSTIVGLHCVPSYKCPTSKPINSFVIPIYSVGLSGIAPDMTRPIFCTK